MNILITQLTRSLRLLITMVVVGLIGFTTYQISLIGTVQPDEAYLAQQKASLPALKLKPNPATLAKLRQLQSSGDTTVPIRSGKSDPFSL